MNCAVRDRLEAELSKLDRNEQSRELGRVSQVEIGEKLEAGRQLKSRYETERTKKISTSIWRIKADEKVQYDEVV